MDIDGLAGHWWGLFPRESK